VNFNGSSEAEEAQKRIVRSWRKQLQNFAYELLTNFY
jgi:hypothetical protein